MLGRINNWELFIIPLLLLVMLIFSFSVKNNNISKKRPGLLWAFIFGSILMPFLFLLRFYLYLFLGIGLSMSWFYS